MRNVIIAALAGGGVWLPHRARDVPCAVAQAVAFATGRGWARRPGHNEVVGVRPRVAVWPLSRAGRMHWLRCLGGQPRHSFGTSPHRE